MVAIGEEYIDFVSITYEIPNDPFNTIEYSVSDIIVKRPQRWVNNKTLLNIYDIDLAGS